MKNKHYVFTRETYWADNGCDCCEPWEWEVFNCISHDNYNGSEGSEEDIRSGIILHDAGIGYDDGIWELTWDKIEAILLDRGLTYEIVDYD